MENIKGITRKSFKIFKIIVFITTSNFLISNLIALIIVTIMKFDYYIVKKIRIIGNKQIENELESKKFPFPSAPGGLGASSPQEIKKYISNRAAD